MSKKAGAGSEMEFSMRQSSGLPWNVLQLIQREVEVMAAGSANSGKVRIHLVDEDATPSHEDDDDSLRYITVSKKSGRTETVTRSCKVYKDVIEVSDDDEDDSSSHRGLARSSAAPLLMEVQDEEDLQDVLMQSPKSASNNQAAVIGTVMAIPEESPLLRTAESSPKKDISKKSVDVAANEERQDSTNVQESTRKSPRVLRNQGQEQTLPSKEKELQHVQDQNDEAHLPKRKRGRPRSSNKSLNDPKDSHAEGTPLDEDLTKDDIRVTDSSPGKSNKRKRGRPKKVSSDVEENQPQQKVGDLTEPVLEENPPKTAKRMRGRPRNNDQVSPATEDSQNDQRDSLSRKCKLDLKESKSEQLEKNFRSVLNEERSSDIPENVESDVEDNYIPLDEDYATDDSGNEEDHNHQGQTDTDMQDRTPEQHERKEVEEPPQSGADETENTTSEDDQHDKNVVSAGEHTDDMPTARKKTIKVKELESKGETDQSKDDTEVSKTKKKRKGYAYMDAVYKHKKQVKGAIITKGVTTIVGVKDLIREKPIDTLQCCICNELFKKRKDHIAHKKECFLRCESCGKTFDHVYMLKRHLLRKLGCGKVKLEAFEKSGKVFACNICSEAFRMSKSLLHHMDTQHSNSPKQFKCKTCDTLFANKRGLMQHKRGCRPNLQCHLCGKKFKLLSKMNAHIKNKCQKYRSGNETPGDFKCKMCDKTFLYKRSLTTHETTHQGYKGFACGICDKTFKAKYVRDAHVRNIHVDPENAKKVMCTCCAKTFLNKAGLKYHMKSHIEDNLKGAYQKCIQDSKMKSVVDFTCFLCREQFCRVFDWFSHMINHYNEDNYNASLDELMDNHREEFDSVALPCPVCYQVFYKKSQINHHMKKHLTAKNINNPVRYECEICGKVFVNHYMHVDHMKHHNKEFNFICDLCGEGFTKKLKFNQHRYKVHDIKSLSIIPCPVCNEVFPCKKIVEQHVRAVHQKIKDWVCKICEKGFGTKYSLSVHMRLHTNEKPFVCPECPDKAYADRSNLLAHCRKKHPNSASVKGRSKFIDDEKEEQHGYKAKNKAPRNQKKMIRPDCTDKPPMKQEQGNEIKLTGQSLLKQESSKSNETQQAVSSLTDTPCYYMMVDEGQRVVMDDAWEVVQDQLVVMQPETTENQVIIQDHLVVEQPEAGDGKVIVQDQLVFEQPQAIESRVIPLEVGTQVFQAHDIPHEQVVIQGHIPDGGQEH